MTDSPPPPRPPPPPTRRTVLLRHTLADGTWHYDWMLERDSSDERRLVTFRVRVRPDELRSAETIGDRLADHRARYLDYQGPLGGGRGSVQRVGEGDVLSLTLGSASLEASVRWPGGCSRLVATALMGDQWVLRWRLLDADG